MRKTSQKYSLMLEDRNKWTRNQLSFLKPLIIFAGTMYLIPIIASLQIDGHIVSLQDFIPSSAVIASVTLYVVNACYDLLIKWSR